jgi:hypothetical protein
MNAFLRNATRSLAALARKGARSLAPAVAIFAVASCSSGASTLGPRATGSSAPPSSDFGDVAVRLALPDGARLDSVGYALLNGTTTVQSGTIVTNDSQTLDFQLGNVPAGGGYEIDLTAASDDGGVNGGVQCLGTSGTFAVVAHSTVQEDVQLVCQTWAGVNSPPFVGPPYCGTCCGTWTSVSSVGLDGGPTSEATADGTTPIVFTATATGADPAALVYNWTATPVVGNGVTLRSNVGNGTATDTLTVTCNSDSVDAVGSTTLTLVVTDSLDASVASCPSAVSTVSITVLCNAPANGDP